MKTMKQQQPEEEECPQKIRMGDQRLLRMSMSASTEIPWDQLRNEPCSYSGARWKPKVRDNALELYTQAVKHTGFFAVLAKCYIPCSVQELRYMFYTPTSDTLCSILDTIARNDFVGGQIVHHVDVGEINDGASSKSVLSSFDDSQNNESELWKGSFTTLTQELTLQSLTFDRGHVFGSMEQWYMLDLLQLNDDPNSGFIKTMMSLAPEECFTESVPTRAKHGHDLLAGYLFEGDSSGRRTKVTFYGEYFGKNKRRHGRTKQEISQSLSARIIKARLVSMAEMTRRFILVIRRRRLGMQVLADRSRKMASNTNCICCQRSFLFARKRMCGLCGYLVCDKCSHMQEREYRVLGSTRPRLDQVRICQRCILRVDECKFTSVSDDDLTPAYIAPDKKEIGKTGNRLCNLLKKFLSLEANESRRVEAKRVIKYMVDAEADAKQVRGSEDRNTTMLTADSSDQQHIDVLQAAFQDDDLPLEACELANNKSRNYAIMYPDDRNKPIEAPKNNTEAKRREIIQRQKLDDLGPVPELDIICSIAAGELKCTGALVTVLHDESVYIAATNMEPFAYQTVPRDESFCTQLAMSNKPLVAKNVQSDIRFSKLGGVQTMGLQFYCGFPLVAEDETVIGAVCCLDQQSRNLTRSEYAVMQKLAKTASKVVQLHSHKNGI